MLPRSLCEAGVGLGGSAGMHGVCPCCQSQGSSGKVGLTAIAMAASRPGPGLGLDIQLYSADFASVEDRFPNVKGKVLDDMVPPLPGSPCWPALGCSRSWVRSQPQSGSFAAPVAFGGHRTMRDCLARSGKWLPPKGHR